MSSQPQHTADERLDRIFRALGDSTRRALLARLSDGPATVSELADPFDMSLAAVGKHIRVLERAGLLQRAIDGRVHHCTLRAAPMRDAGAWMQHYRQFWNATLDSLAEHLETDA